MNRLSPDTLPAYKKLRKDNPEILWVQDLFRDYVWTTLTESDKTNFEKNDFELFEWYFENLKTYYQICVENWIKKNISLEVLEVFIMGQSTSEFRSFIKNKVVFDLIQFWKIDNIKIFFSKDFYNITDKKSFEKFLTNVNFNKIVKLIYQSNTENIKVFFWKDWAIKNKKELEDFLNRPESFYILDLIEKWYTENIKLFFWRNIYNITDKKVFEEFLRNINSKRISNLIKFWNIENIKLFFWEYWILKDKKEFEYFFENPESFYTLYLIEHWNNDNMKIFFWKDAIIKDKKELNDFLNNPKNHYILYLIENLNTDNIKIFFWKESIIKDKKELEDFLNNPKIFYLLCLFENWNLFILEKLVEKVRDNIYNLENIINFFLQNIYIKNLDNLIVWTYKSEKVDIFNFLEKYKPNQFENSFLNNQSSNPFFSLIDLPINHKVSWQQKVNIKQTIWDQSFFDINKKKKDITPEVQLAVNRLFSPLFPMTRLLKLVNWNTNYVSVDVESNNQWINLCKLNDNIADEINMFFIMVYQFLTLDYDRFYEKNLWKKFIIYDFDFMFIDELNLGFFDNTFNKPELFNEMWEILYTLKDYLIKEVDELIVYYEKEKKEDVVLIFEKLRIRLDLLNFSNLIYFNKQVNSEIENFAKKVDSERYV